MPQRHTGLALYSCSIQFYDRLIDLIRKSKYEITAFVEELYRVFEANE